jgi:pimeloyl-ACP methyl ester carboxylesterase
VAYQETSVQRNQHRIYVRDHPGAQPAIILMHGFPDNVHLYDRLSPYLSPPRRVVLFDFLGWGSSDKPFGYPYTTDNQVGDLDAVITQLVRPASARVWSAPRPNSLARRNAHGARRRPTPASRVRHHG